MYKMNRIRQAALQTRIQSTNSEDAIMDFRRMENDIIKTEETIIIKTLSNYAINSTEITWTSDQENRSYFIPIRISSMKSTCPVKSEHTFRHINRLIKLPSPNNTWQLKCSNLMKNINGVKFPLITPR